EWLQTGCFLWPDSECAKRRIKLELEYFGLVEALYGGKLNAQHPLAACGVCRVSCVSCVVCVNWRCVWLVNGARHALFMSGLTGFSCCGREPQVRSWTR